MTNDQESLSIQYGELAECIVLRVTGELDTATYPQLRDTMVKCLAEQPSAVIVVVDELHVTTAGLLSVFVRVSVRFSDWPGVPVLLVVLGERTRRLFEHTPVSRFVPIHPTLEEAVRAAASQPQRRRAKIALSRLDGTARQAREFTKQVCEYWLLAATAVADAVIVANELVENVLVHAESPPSLRLELRTKQLSVAVGDLSPAPARIREGNEDHRGGLGLLLVAQLAKAWGSNPVMSGGKVVWAVLDIQPPASRFRPFDPGSDQAGTILRC